MIPPINISRIPDTPITTLALGVFDGVHRGHRTIIDQSDFVLSLSPHPDLVLGKCPELQLLSTPKEFQILLPNSATLEFTSEISKLSPNDFLNSVVLAYFNPRHIVVGYDYRFGLKGRGDISTIKQWALTHNIQVTQVPLQTWNGLNIKSSAIRKSLEYGEFDTAIALLGHDYLMAGTVVHGSGRGRGIGYPTANLEFEEHKLLPHSGVYYGHATIPAGNFACLVNIGVAPTLGGQTKRVEVYLLDYSGDIYGQELHCYLNGWLRSEQKFGSIDELRQQIAQDEMTVRQKLSANLAV